jgi:hypothetical protein
MEGDERSNIALKSTYGSIQNNELHQAMLTSTVPSKLTGRVKKLKEFIQTNVFYANVYIIRWKFRKREKCLSHNKRLLILVSVRTLLVLCS